MPAIGRGSHREDCLNTSENRRDAWADSRRALPNSVGAVCAIAVIAPFTRITQGGKGGQGGAIESNGGNRSPLFHSLCGAFKPFFLQPSAWAGEHGQGFGGQCVSVVPPGGFHPIQAEREGLSCCHVNAHERDGRVFVIREDVFEEVGQSSSITTWRPKEYLTIVFCKARTGRPGTNRLPRFRNRVPKRRVWWSCVGLRGCLNHRLAFSRRGRYRGSSEFIKTPS